jgi:Transposase
MKHLSTNELNNVLSLIDGRNSAHHIAKITGLHTSTVTHHWTLHCPNVPKPSGGRPLKLSPTDVCHAVCLINTGKADNAAQVAQSLQTITNDSVTHQTVHSHLKKAGLKAVVKKKCPLLSMCHRHDWMDFATSYRDWTIDDWKWLVWSDEVKFNCLNSDGWSWVYKRAGEGLSD